MKTNSIRKRVLYAFLIFAIIQTAVYIAMISSTGIRRSVYEQSYGSFNFQVISRAKILSQDLNSARVGFTATAKYIEQGIEDYFKSEKITFEEKSGQNITDILEISTNLLLDFLNNSKQVSGVFIFLNGESYVKDCVYIRDNSYGGNIRSNESKIYVRGPSAIAKKYGYQLYYLWQPNQDFTNLKSEFFNKPMEHAKNKSKAPKDLFYWSRPFSISENDPEMITLTVPLVDENYVPYAVCGFEISFDFIKKMLPYTELSDKPSMYIIDDEVIGGSRRIISGPYAEQLFINDELKIYDVKSDFRLFKIKSSNALLPDFLCIEEGLELYGKSSVFIDEKWYLYGIIDEQPIEKYPKSVMQTLYVSLAIVIIISIIYMIFITSRITKPIKLLSEKVGKIDPEEEIDLPETHILEIDELTRAIKLLNDEVIYSATRLNTIIDMVGVSIGGFEERAGENKVLITEPLAKLFGLPSGTKRVTYKEWTDILNKINYKKEEDVCRYIDEEVNEERWLRIKMTQNNTIVSGVIMDVTEEIKELKRLEYERNYDSMTQILNRRAFIEIIGKNLESNMYDKAALLMIDLDNLKYINDTFGHDAGDSYLILMADALRGFEKDGGIISRMAGDEFTVFLPYEHDKETFKNYIMLMIDICKKNSFTLPDNKKQRIRFSTGISWFPEDSRDINELIKYADFAMYEIKHNIKGTVGEFDIEAYKNKSSMLNSLEKLDMLIEKEEIRYMLQPVVSAKDGEVIGYEMLMRSDVPGLHTPYEILNIAKAQSKLYYIELIGLKKLILLLDENEHILKNKLIFFNSILSVVIKEDDWKGLNTSLQNRMENVVLEITEGEKASEQIKKRKHIAVLGTKFAIDNYSEHYASEKMLANMNPDYVKIDMSLIRDINIDEKKQLIVAGIVKHCNERGVKTIAEGVETYDEMKTLSSIGLDYYQGFYFARPSYELQDIPLYIKKQICSLWEGNAD